MTDNNDSFLSSHPQFEDISEPGPSSARDIMREANLIIEGSEEEDDYDEEFADRSGIEDEDLEGGSVVDSEEKDPEF